MNILSNKHFKKSRITLVVVSALMIACGLLLAPRVTADRFDEQIRELQNQNANNQNALSALEVEAASYQDAISKLQSQINQLQSQINQNQDKQAELKAKIEEGKRELERQRAILSADIKAMYVDGDISTIEMLATSRNLSDFVDREAYRNAVQKKIQDTLAAIKKLQKELTEQKALVDRLLEEQKAQQTQLAYSRSEQTRLLSLNESQQNEYNSRIQQNNDKISDLRQQQIIANLALFGGGVQPGVAGGGGYPWGNAYCVHTGQVEGDCYNYDWYFDGSAWDPWGYGFRNCTSWVAFKLAANKKTGFTYLGNANQWPSRAAARGISVTYGSGAQPGDAAVNPRGYYGHVMYVEAVLEDGRVVVSDYNRAGDGYYRGPESGNANVLSQGSLVFIHF